MHQLQNISAPIGRVLLAILFVVSGWGKITGYAGTQGYMESMGVPGMLLPVVIVLELIGGIMIAVGFKARIVAFLLAGFTVLSAFIFHFNLSDQGETINFMKNLAIAGGFLMIFAHGPGAYSMDDRHVVRHHG